MPEKNQYSFVETEKKSVLDDAFNAVYGLVNNLIDDIEAREDSIGMPVYKNGEYFLVSSSNGKTKYVSILDGYVGGLNLNWRYQISNFFLKQVIGNIEEYYNFAQESLPTSVFADGCLDPKHFSLKEQAKSQNFAPAIVTTSKLKNSCVTTEKIAVGQLDNSFFADNIVFNYDKNNIHKYLIPLVYTTEGENLFQGASLLITLPAPEWGLAIGDKTKLKIDLEYIVYLSSQLVDNKNKGERSDIQNPFDRDTILKDTLFFLLSYPSQEKNQKSYLPIYATDMEIIWGERGNVEANAQLRCVKTIWLDTKFWDAIPTVTIAVQKFLSSFVVSEEEKTWLDILKSRYILNVKINMSSAKEKEKEPIRTATTSDTTVYNFLKAKTSTQTQKTARQQTSTSQIHVSEFSSTGAIATKVRATTKQNIGEPTQKVIDIAIQHPAQSYRMRYRREKTEKDLETIKDQLIILKQNVFDGEEETIFNASDKEGNVYRVEFQGNIQKKEKITIPNKIDLEFGPATDGIENGIATFPNGQNMEVERITVKDKDKTSITIQTKGNPPAGYCQVYATTEYKKDETKEQAFSYANTELKNVYNHTKQKKIYTNLDIDTTENVLENKKETAESFYLLAEGRPVPFKKNIIVKNQTNFTIDPQLPEITEEGTDMLGGENYKIEYTKEQASSINYTPLDEPKIEEKQEEQIEYDIQNNESLTFLKAYGGEERNRLKEKYENLYKNTQEQLELQKKDYKETLGQYQDKLEEVNQEYEELTNKYNSERHNLDISLKEIADKNKQIQTLLKSDKSKQQKINELEEQINAMLESHTKLKEEVTSYVIKNDDLQIALQEKKEQYIQSQQNVENLQGQLEELNLQDTNNKQTIEQLEKDIVAGLTEQMVKQAEIEELSFKIQEVQEEQNKNQHEFQTAKAKMLNTIEEFRNKIETYKQTETEIEEKHIQQLEKLNNEINQSASKLRDFKTASAEEKRTLEKQIKDLNQKVALWEKRHEDALKRETKLSSEVIAIKREKANLLKQLDKLKVDIDKSAKNLSEKEQALRNKQKELETAQTKQKKLQDEKAKLTEQQQQTTVVLESAIKSKEQEISDLLSSVESYQKEIQEIKKDYEDTIAKGAKDFAITALTMLSKLIGPEIVAGNNELAEIATNLKKETQNLLDNLPPWHEVPEQALTLADKIANFFERNNHKLFEVTEREKTKAQDDLEAYKQQMQKALEEEQENIKNLQEESVFSRKRAQIFGILDTLTGVSNNIGKVSDSLWKKISVLQKDIQNTTKEAEGATDIDSLPSSRDINNLCNRVKDFITENTNAFYKTNLTNAAQAREIQRLLQENQRLQNERNQALSELEIQNINNDEKLQKERKQYENARQKDKNLLFSQFQKTQETDAVLQKINTILEKAKILELTPVNTKTIDFLRSQLGKLQKETQAINLQTVDPTQFNIVKSNHQKIQNRLKQLGDNIETGIVLNIQQPDTQTEVLDTIKLKTDTLTKQKQPTANTVVFIEPKQPVTESFHLYFTVGTAVGKVQEQGKTWFRIPCTINNTLDRGASRKIDVYVQWDGQTEEKIPFDYQSGAPVNVRSNGTKIQGQWRATFDPVSNYSNWITICDTATKRFANVRFGKQEPEIINIFNNEYVELREFEGRSFKHFQEILLTSQKRSIPMHFDSTAPSIAFQAGEQPYLMFPDGSVLLPIGETYTCTTTLTREEPEGTV